MELFTSFEFTIPNEKKSNVIGCVLTLLEIDSTPTSSLEESKSITRNTVPLLSTIFCTSVSSIWINP